ncbi:MAG: hypothetical protein V3S51_08110 [Dehalococcoidia bacterium]
MDNNQITFRVTLELHADWANSLTQEELVEFIRDRLNGSLGFRGEVKKINVRKK